MFNRGSNSQNSSNDNTFDFNYKMQISGRKGRTGQNFNVQDGFDFQQFGDFREDRTQKSEITSQKKWLPSEFNKRSQEHSVDFSGKRKSSFINDEVGSRMKGGSGYTKYNSPKFNAGQTNSYRTIPHNMNPTHDHQTSRLSEISQPNPHLASQKNRSEKDQNSFIKPDIRNVNGVNMPHFSQKVSPTYSPSIQSPTQKERQGYTIPNPQLTIETDYEDTLATIQYLNNEGEQLDYETSKMMQEIAYYQDLLNNNQQNQENLDRYNNQTNSLNALINQQKSLQRKLCQTSAELQENFDQLVASVVGMKFERPAVIKDQAKAIIEEINQLKAQFLSLRRDQGSLNLSSTLQNINIPTSVENRLSFNVQPSPVQAQSPEDMIFKQYVREINEYDRQIPNYLYNTKMLIVKDEWKLFQNSEIVIQCSYRNYPQLCINIGNKTIKNLTNFSLIQGASLIADKEILMNKSYYTHVYRMIKFSQPFLKIELKYTVQDQTFLMTTQRGSQKDEGVQKFTFFLPTFTLKHGEFIPITRKEYNNESRQHKEVLEEMKNIERPIDRKIIKNSIKELRIYFPNLIYDDEEEDGTCRGLFQVWDSNDGALVKVKQNGNLVRIRVKNNIPFLMKGLQFLLTAL